MFFTAILLLPLLALSTLAKRITVTVGGNTTNSPQSVFSPRSVKALSGDVVVFNFTSGNHSAIQSTFSSPCIPAHESNITINGFYSGFRDTANGTVVSQFEVAINDGNVNDTLWFYDISLCGQGGVGGINVNESSWETLDGFERNAKRLNGTGGNRTPSKSATSGSPTSTDSPTFEGDNGAHSLVYTTGFALVPLLSLAFAML